MLVSVSLVSAAIAYLITAAWAGTLLPINLERVERASSSHWRDWEKAFLESFVPAKPMDCIVPVAPGARSQDLPSICYVSGRGRSVPLFDYGSIFGSASPCTRPFVKRERICLLTSDISGPVVLTDNISGATVAIAQSRVPVVASPQSISVQSLTIDSDLLLVAGGDIDIARLASTVTAPVRITLISATQSIRVGDVTGSISLKTIAPRKISVPATRSTDSYLMPPVVPMAIVAKR